jgi:hypothetical protein
MNRLEYLLREATIWSWAVTIGLDVLWGLLEGWLGFSVIGILVVLFVIPLVFLLCAGTVTLIQRFGAGESWETALQQGLLLGVFAAIPLPLTLLALGIPLGNSRKRVEAASSAATAETYALGLLTRNWTRLEQILEAGLPDRRRDQTMDEVIDLLYARRRITAAECDELQRLRQDRNRIVHEGKMDRLSEVADRARRVADRLEPRLRG